MKRDLYSEVSARITELERLKNGPKIGIRPDFSSQSWGQAPTALLLVPEANG
jgi:hypothetical protein